jgi:hypothetical protein
MTWNAKRFANEGKIKMEYEIQAAAPEEADFFYSNPEMDKELGCIGHLRGDFGQNGKAFWTSWWEHQSDLKTDIFKEEFDDLINMLRENGILKDMHSMVECCRMHPEARIPGSRLPETYGFRVITDKYRYYFRCFPHGGDYNFYVYTYQDKALRQLERAKADRQPITPIKKQHEPGR